jgi:hypothetical protein
MRARGRLPRIWQVCWVRRSAVVCACLCVAVGACDERKGPSARDAGLTEPSPNASILPAPLASLADTPGVGKPEDAGRPIADAGSSDAAPPEPRSLREDQALSAEIPHESSGLTLVARFRWLDVPPPVRTPELNVDGVQRLRDAVGFDAVIYLAGGRMRLAFASRAFTMPQGAELHARDDLYGHALLWPNRTTYTVLSAGALRSTLSEQRADVVPLVRARVSALPEGSLLGAHTERLELSTPTGKLELEQARSQNPQPLTGAWPSGATLCHLLVELVGASPTLAACRADLLPLRAAYSWPNGGHFVFEVSRLTRRTDLDPASLAMPPAGAEFRQSELPSPPPMVLLSDDELSELRLRPAARSEKPEPSAPKAGLLVVNHSESLRYISIDGAPALRLPPGSEQLLLGLRPGKYQIAARDFFGAEDTTSKTVELPARFTLGDEPEKAR